MEYASYKKKKKKKLRVAIEKERIERDTPRLASVIGLDAFRD